MFDEVFGLPLHPLVVHGAVVFAPLLALVSLAFALAPRVRPRLDWAVVLLSLATPVAVWVAKESGEALKENRYATQTPPAVAEHESFANPLLFSVLGLAVAALLLVYFARRTESRAVTLVLTVLTVAGALAVGFYAVRSGHTGATAVWGG